MNVRRLPIRLVSDESRVIALPFIPGGGGRMRTLFERIEALDEPVVAETFTEVRAAYGDRHRDLEAVFGEHFHTASAMVGLGKGWSHLRKLLAGAYLTMEYAIESAALFNPSVVPHPDQSGVGDGAVRFIMSLRATGEGHVSSIVFRTGLIEPSGNVAVDPPGPLLSRLRIAPDRRYLNQLFGRKLHEMGTNGPVVAAVLGRVGERFTLPELNAALEQAWPDVQHVAGARAAMDTIVWLAQSNYHIDLPDQASLSDLVIFPLSDAESRGVEDLRLVRFTEDDGSVQYFGTYTGYNGLRTLPMMIQTSDFRRIEVHSLNGACAINKGMALFPRRIGGHYVMCSRIDGENLYIMLSDYVHFWESAEMLQAPKRTWEMMQVGNCGSPIETSEGWLLLTHGVGPMRSYSIGAMLLDREDPLRVIGHLRQPLLRSMGEEREGYVPNVVYTCGAMVHQDRLYLPYALADRSTTVAVVEMDELLNRLLDSR